MVPNSKHNVPKPHFAILKSWLLSLPILPVIGACASLPGPMECELLHRGDSEANYNCVYELAQQGDTESQFYAGFYLTEGDFRPSTMDRHPDHIEVVRLWSKAIKGYLNAPRNFRLISWADNTIQSLIKIHLGDHELVAHGKIYKWRGIVPVNTPPEYEPKVYINRNYPEAYKWLLVYKHMRDIWINKLGGDGALSGASFANWEDILNHLVSERDKAEGQKLFTAYIASVDEK